MWDNLSCWPSSAIGKTVAVACPKFIFAITGKEGFVYRNCTSDGWSNSFPRHDVACGLDINNTIEDDKNTYYMNVKTMYTVGYGTSLVSLSIAIVIHCSFRMTKCDVKNYLEKIYSVPVGAVRTRIQYCTNKKRNHLSQRVKRPDYKVAHIQLAQQQTFQFPEIFPQKDTAFEPGSVEEMQDQFMQDEQQRQKADPRRGGVTEWFGL
ncbi:UNVERIFIED_CONTAM: hypothetical protein FKN15_063168 [Acipenser sinensis]